MKSKEKGMENLLISSDTKQKTSSDNDEDILEPNNTRILEKSAQKYFQNVSYLTRVKDTTSNAICFGLLEYCY